MSSTILRSDNRITDPSRQRIERDPILGLEDWVWCLDFTNPFCNPTEAPIPPTGTKFVSLARDPGDPTLQGQGGTLRNAGATITQVAGRGGLVFPAGTHNVTDFVEFTYGSQDFYLDNDDYLAVVWDKQPLTGFNTANYAPILWDSVSNANAASLWMDLGLGGVVPRGAVGTGSAGQSVLATEGVGQGSPRQIAFAREGTKLSLFVNGVLVDVNPNGPASLQASGPVSTKLAGNHVATIYKTAACKLGGAYDRPVAEIVAQDWRACMNKFV
ncbi:hypothetical protein PVT71_18245 [Salipiger sp. H15]|uniref:LamG domain-containing protein n=1 Tax=Alloyangia sp. H15 TaxID=3029062 RepID=A0AAU8ANR2_9RHOB